MNLEIKAEEQLPYGAEAVAPANEESFVQHARRVLTTRFRQAGLKPAEAEDLTQECLVELITHIDRFDAARGSVDSWISGFARNAVKSWWRREVPRRASELHYMQVPEAGLAKSESMMEISAIKYGLGELCLIDQELLYMRFGLGMSFEDIATNANMTCVNARKRVSRAVERLRRDPAIREALGF
ncbi:MAG TPA: sigma-70 family RNA polymerase sigma factor [Fimbriimonadaceae bacterium]|nr:sigma-70 family RNA polymerase sigma factor [Fimbriimonadaceae bacterium]